MEESFFQIYASAAAPAHGIQWSARGCVRWDILLSKQVRLVTTWSTVVITASPCGHSTSIDVQGITLLYGGQPELGTLSAKKPTFVKYSSQYIVKRGVERYMKYV